MRRTKLQRRREELEARVEEMIALLDLLDGDADLEPSLAAFMGSDDDREEENEHGGDILDQPHDPDTDLEYSLGWRNPTFGDADPMPGWSGIDGFDQGNGLIFDGDGHHIARKMLRDVVSDHRKLRKALNATRVSPGYGRYV
jgi:hypothetical protein